VATLVKAVQTASANSPKLRHWMVKYWKEGIDARERELISLYRAKRRDAAQVYDAPDSSGVVRRALTREETSDIERKATELARDKLREIDIEWDARVTAVTAAGGGPEAILGLRVQDAQYESVAPALSPSNRWVFSN
jgi:hypothetical protein